METTKVRMLRDIGGHAAGDVVEAPKERALSWVRAGVASLRLHAPPPPPSMTADPAVEVHGGPRRSPMNRMAPRRRLTKDTA